MIVVSDTSPLNYLILIKQDTVLPTLFTTVVTTPQVLEELLAAKAPVAVRAWASAPPKWLELREARTLDPTIQLGKGETSAISLALELRDQHPQLRLLIDERAGRDSARSRGLETAGTLTVLAQASRSRLLDLPSAIESLRSTLFHISEALVQAVLQADREYFQT